RFHSAACRATQRRYDLQDRRARRNLSVCRWPSDRNRARRRAAAPGCCEKAAGQETETACMIGTCHAVRVITDGGKFPPTAATKASIRKLPIIRDTQGQISCAIRRLVQGYLLT